jgi:hypothetical protein
LQKETETFVFGVGAALLNEFAKIGEIGGVIEVFYCLSDLGFGQLECTESGLDLKASPALVFHFIMDVGVAETGIVEEVLFV